MALMRNQTLSRIFILGATGRVGQRLMSRLSEGGYPLEGPPPDDPDILSFESVRARLRDYAPTLVINCAALTNVDYCAEHPEEAYRVNALGVQNIALVCAEIGATLCHISTNEVFDGLKGSPYWESDPTHPINPYGYSKWAAEVMIRDALPRHMIVRTSWLFAHDGVNFLHKIKAAALAGKPLSVVTDEIACPTYNEDFVEALVKLVQTERCGTYHLVNEGYASRYDFARCILDTYGMRDYPITPISLAQFKRPSTPPPFGVLRNLIGAHLGIVLRHWREAVEAFVEREKREDPHV